MHHRGLSVSDVALRGVALTPVLRTGWRLISLADWYRYETSEDKRDATDRERQREASGPFTNEAKEIRPNSAAEIAGAVDESNADPGDGGRQHLRWQCPERSEAPEECGHSQCQKSQDTEVDVLSGKLSQEQENAR